MMNEKNNRDNLHRNELTFLPFYGALEEAIGTNYADAFFVTDDNVLRLYPNLIGKNRFVMRAGEDSKTLSTVAEICREMMRLGCDRNATVVAVGGGVVGDTAGFAASVYMRGVAWANVPTTLLAQVDSGIGGKTGVDLTDYKNIIGAFWLPRQILICPALLGTLNEREWRCGMGEIVKTAYLDAGVFKAFTCLLGGLNARQTDSVETVVEACASFKQQVVTRDFTEKGMRKVLNLGHTVGHALEKCDAHRLSHGEYVLWGMLAEAFVFRDRIEENFYGDYTNRIKSVLSGATLPPFSADEVAFAALADKKNSGGKISVMTALAVGNIQESFTDSATLGSSLARWQNSFDEPQKAK